MSTIRSIVNCLFLLTVCLVSACSLPSAQVEKSGVTTLDQVRSFTPLEPKRWSLRNGVKVIFLKDKELPLVKGKLFLRAGSLWADRYPIGTTSALGDGMRSGGAGELSADALDRELERLAASIASSFSSEFGGVGFSCLSSDVDRVFELFSDVVLRPRFDADRLMLWKGQALEGIRRRVEDPGTVATIAFTQLMYGDTPYGRVSRSHDITRISRADLVQLHSDFVRPDGAILVITGDVSQERAAQLAERYFGAWEPRGSRMPAAPAVNFEPKPGLYFITLPFAQASVKFGQLGVPRFTPDYVEIDVFNEVFGSGGFGSRLMKRVRTELGLSYGVSGGVAPGVVRGTNHVFLQTKAASVGPAIEESIKVLKDLQGREPGVDELNEKKAAIENSYIFNFSSVEEIAGRIARQELLEYPADYDKTYLPRVLGVRAAGVRGVAESRWDTSKFVVVVVGNETALAELERARQIKDSPIHDLELTKLGFNEAIVVPSAR